MKYSELKALMESGTFKVKPLKWNRRDESHIAQTSIIRFAVTEDINGSGLVWYDINGSMIDRCGNVENGKRKCENIYYRMLYKVLEEQ